MPEGFRSTVTGRGKPGDWQVLLDRTVSAFPALPHKGPEYADQSVLAQLSHERIDDHFPLLVFEDEGHGLARHANRVTGYGRAIGFLLEKLGAGVPA